MINLLRILLEKIGQFRGKQRAHLYLDGKLGPLVRKVRGGGKLLLYPSSVQDRVFLDGQGETNPSLVDQIKQLPPNGVFVDIGANAGFYSLMASKVLGPEGRILSIEPSSREFFRLAFAKHFNPHQCRWDLVNSAVGENGELTIDTGVGHTGMNQITEETTTTTNMLQKVGSLNLGGLLDFYSFDHIDLIKIDVEGYELRALSGAITWLERQQIGTIALEVTDKFLQQFGDSQEELYEFLESFGYLGRNKRATAWQYDEIFQVAKNVI